MTKIKKWIKNCPVVYSILLFICKYTLEYIKNGYYKNMLSYFFSVRRKEKKALKQYGFFKSRIYKSTAWRFGKGKDGAFRRYYVSHYNGRVTFVKISKNDSTVKNEIKFAEYFKNTDFPFLMKTVDTVTDFNGGFDLLAIEFCQDIKGFSLPETVSQFEALCAQFLTILDALQSLKVVHADIHMNNLMLSGDRLMLIDFGISYSENLENTVDYVARPGTFYKIIDDKRRLYDDAYSFVKMIEKLSPPKEFLQGEQYLKILNRIGKYGFEAELKN